MILLNGVSDAPVYYFCGLPLSDFVNIVIAITAIVAILISIWFSRKSLNQAKELIKKQNDAQLFDGRYEVIEYFHSIFNGDFEEPKDFNKETFLKNYWKMQALFTNYEDITQASVALTNYFHGNPLPDYTSRIHGTSKYIFTIKDESSTESGELSIKAAFIEFYLRSLEQLEKELGIVEK